MQHAFKEFSIIFQFNFDLSPPSVSKLLIMDVSSGFADFPDCNSILKTVESISSQFEAKKMGFQDENQSFSSQSRSKRTELFIVMLEILAIFMRMSLRAFGRILKTADCLIVYGFDFCLTFFMENASLLTFNFSNIKNIGKELKLRKNFFIVIVPLIFLATLLTICRLATIVTKILLYKVPLP